MTVRELAIDMGQGASRVAIRSNNGEVAQSQVPGFWASQDPFRHLADVVLSTIGTGQTTPVRIAVGMTGFDDDLGVSSFCARLTASGVRGELAVCSDSVTAYLGALGETSGAVVAAGTGAVALGVNLTGMSARSDGWGSMLGDRGSGHWIGHQAVREALKCYDRRIESDLIELVESRWGEVRHLSKRWRSDPPTPDNIAAIVPEMAALARSGEPIVLKIFEHAGRLLGESITDVAQRTGLHDGAFRVAGTGGLFRMDDLLIPSFTHVVNRDLPGASLESANGDPLAGSMVLASSTRLATVFEALVTRRQLTVES